MSTPVQLQFQELKKENPDAVLFFQLGDFYEMFYEDALLASRVLGITLTARHKGSENEMPMCGMPVHSHKGYLEALVEAGYKVAIAGQVEDPETKRIDRKITRLVTPGTSMEEGNLVPEKNSFLCAISRGKNEFGLAFSDLSTGDFRTAVFAEEADFLAELQKINPSEILITDELFSDEKFCENIKNFHLTVRKTLAGKRASEVLQTHFNVSNLSVFGVEKFDLLIEVSGMIIVYLQETQKTDLSHLTKLVRYTSRNTMVLDAQTLRHLEIFRPIREDEGSATLLSVFVRPLTAMGNRLLRQWVLNPLCDEKRIVGRQSVVEEIFQNHVMCEGLIDVLKKIADLERLLSRLVTNRGNGRDLAFFRDSLSLFPALKGICEASSQELLRSVSNVFSGFDVVFQKLETSLVEAPPLEITQGGIFKSGFSAELDELREINAKADDWLKNFLEDRKKESGISSLKIKYSKNFGFCLEVPNSQRDKAPESWIRRQTLVNAERFSTPELAKYEERAMQAQSKAFELEHSLFQSLREELCQNTAKIQAAAKAVAQIDTLLTFSRTAQKWRWSKPIIDAKSAVFEVADGRHPVIEMLSATKFISNDLEMSSDSSHMHLITGPNMAGKSTFLRQNALIILLAQIGSFVPARAAKLSVFDRIFTRVGASDNLAGGQSTFFVEMMETATILNAATERSFVILDEIGRGTSTFDGISIAWAITEFLHDKTKAKTLFATHYHELIDLAEELSGAKNFHVSVAQNEDGIIFLRKIAAGGISDSFGIEVAASAGLPKSVISQAREILQKLESENLIEKPNLFSVSREIQSNVVQPREDSAKVSELEKKINNLDPNELSPKEALEVIFELKSGVQSS